MIGSIQRFFDNHLNPNTREAGNDSQLGLRLAVAALLIEVTASDDHQRPEEHQAMLNAVRSHFGLGDNEARELISLAQVEHADSTDYFQFTRLINQSYSPEQKVQLMEALWQIAYADNELHHIEEHVIRRLAELIHVPHKAFIATKHRAQAPSPGSVG
ncbi:MAG: TerB family tellurite resistance protein [Candidatus Sedimenticola sp. (ex Thyasira tokunagai)]